MEEVDQLSHGSKTRQVAATVLGFRGTREAPEVTAGRSREGCRSIVDDYRMRTRLLEAVQPAAIGFKRQKGVWVYEY